MRAEIISIGDELTSGQRLDTNSQWLAERLLEIGVPVAFHTTVGDTLADNVLVFRQAAERSDIVVATGGLGPTADDLTRQALADVAGVRRKRDMPPANVVQAMFPQGSRPIANPNGTAPGIDIEIPRAVGKPARIFALPGVPAEMKEMWAATVAPAIQEMLGVRRVIAHYRIKCFGVGESDLEAMMPDLIARQRYPLVGITVHQATITLRITAEGETAEAARSAMQPTINTIHDCLGNLIFGDENDELQDAVLRNLRARQETLAVVEWGTAGVVTQWLSQSSWAEGAFEGGLVVRDHVTLERLFPLSSASWLEHGFRNAPFTQELAKAAREHLRTDWVLAIGPLPDEGAGDRTVFAGLATKDGAATKPLNHAGHPAITRDRTAKQALDWLRKRASPPADPGVR
jgi:nicotinamide-nucleotide amidase